MKNSNLMMFTILIKDQEFIDQILIIAFVQGEDNNLMVTFLMAIEFLVLGVIRMQEEGPQGCMQINLTLKKQERIQLTVEEILPGVESATQLLGS